LTGLTGFIFYFLDGNEKKKDSLEAAVDDAFRELLQQRLYEKLQRQTSRLQGLSLYRDQ